FSPTTDELEAQQERLIDIAAGVREAVATTQDDRALWHMRRDLLAPHRSPSTYDDQDYPDSGDRAILLAHLAGIEGQIGGAGSWRQLNGARSQLMAYSFVVGDRTFQGFFGDELRPQDAPAGRYRVRLHAGAAEATGWVGVREDPGS
ncbi:MAG: hypothetical protein ACI84D_003190, partial [Thalassolituus oleivorans]